MSLPERGKHPATYRELGVRAYRRDHGEGSREAYIKVRDAYLRVTRLRCEEFLRSSGVVEVLRELGEREDIRVRREEEEAETLGTNLELTWKFGKDDLGEKGMNITALPVTGDIVIQGAVASVVPQEVWSTDGGKDIVRNLILHAYHYPQQLV